MLKRNKGASPYGLRGQCYEGYGTEEHRNAVLRLGCCFEHREMFVRKLLAGRVDPAQIEMCD